MAEDSSQHVQGCSIFEDVCNLLVINLFKHLTDLYQIKLCITWHGNILDVCEERTPWTV